MSRAYRIKVKESLRQDLSASDEVCADLEILEILPCEQMAKLVADQLKARGFEEKDGKLVRTKDGVTVTVDPKEGSVTVRTDKEQKVDLEVEKEGMGDEDYGERGEKKLRGQLSEQAKKELERQAAVHKDKLQAEATAQLEKALNDVRKELNDAVNGATREALKQKAAGMGQIKEMSEDPQAGSLTIKVEV